MIFRRFNGHENEKDVISNALIEKKTKIFLSFDIILLYLHGEIMFCSLFNENNNKFKYALLCIGHLN